MQNQLAITIATLSLESEVALREVETSFAEMLLKYKSMNQLRDESGSIPEIVLEKSENPHVQEEPLPTVTEEAVPAPE